MKKQLPQYMKIDSCCKGISLVIVYTDKDLKKSEIQTIKNKTALLHKVNLKVVIVDARIENEESASKE